MTVALGCEEFGDGLAGFLGQPASAVTAVGFVAAGLAVLAGRPATVRHRLGYGLLVAAVGVGSVIQHGPHPPWQAYAHDLPLVAVLSFLALDTVRDLTGGGPPGRRLSAWWCLLPTAGMVPVVAAGAGPATATQAVLAAVTITLGVARAWRRPALRATILVALALLAAGAVAGSLTDRTDWCRPDSLLQGHALWHLLAAAALWRLAPTVGAGPALPADHGPRSLVGAATGAEPHDRPAGTPAGQPEET